MIAKFVIVLIMLVAIAQASTTQLSYETFSLAPVLSDHVFFLTYCGLFLNVGLLAVDVIVRRLRHSQVSSSSLLQAASADDQHTTNHIAWHDRAMPEKVGILVFFYCLYVGANASYVTAIASRRLHPSVVAAIFASCPCWVVIISFCIVKIRPTIWQSLGVVAGCTGVVLALKPWGERSATSDRPSEWWALVCSVISPILAALYKVMFNKIFASKASDWTTPMRVLGQLAGVNLVLGTGLMFGLVYPLGVETPFWAESSVVADKEDGNSTARRVEETIASGVSSDAWLVQSASSLTGLLFNVLVNWGVTVAKPVYIAVATLIATALSTAFDLAFRGMGLSWIQGVGFLCIALSFGAISWAAHVEQQQQDEEEQQQQQQWRQSEVALTEAEEAERREDYGTITNGSRT